MIDPAPDDDLFRWQALFQRSSDPVFLLNRRRRLLFVNRACEALTGLTTAQMCGRVCRRQRQPEPGSWEAIATALHPPAEVLNGQSSRARRLFVGAGASRSWWDVEFMPLRSANGLLAVVGKIHLVGTTVPGQPAPLPEKLLAVRERLAQRYSFASLDSELPAMQRLAEQARLAVQTQAAVLLAGPPGAGKHWLARVIHHQGQNRDRAFARIDCAGLPSAVLNTVLLGPAGLLRRASLGTLYLHDVSALPRELQARLADGLAQAEPNRPRLIAGLPQAPAEEVAAGRLLDDLACALGTLTIVVPPLAERSADLPHLLQHLLARVHQEGPRKSVTPQALELLNGYRWPGNVRELLAVLSEAHDRAMGERIDAAELPAYLRRTLQLEQLPGRPLARPLPLDQLLEQVERRMLVLALQQAQGNKSKAADLLAIWRPRLLRRMEALGIPGGD